MDIALILNRINGSEVSVAYINLESIVNYHVGKQKDTIRINNQEKHYSGDAYLLKRRVDLIKDLLEKPEKVDPTFLEFLIDPVKNTVKGENHLKDFGDIFFNEMEIEGINRLVEIYRPGQSKFLSLIEKMNLENIVKDDKKDNSVSSHKLKV